MDRDQMLEQLSIVLPKLPPKSEDPNAPRDAFPVNPANPEGNWAYVQKEITGTNDVSRYPQVRDKPVILATLRTPASATESVPLFIFFGGFGNAADMYWERCNPRGWGICVFNLTALQPDNGAGLTSFLIGLVNQGN